MNPLLVIKATNFAAIAHRDQRRKNQDKTPYINHPIEVMTMLFDAGVTDTATLCAAVLHDTIEDTLVTQDQLLEEFGHEIAIIVTECSDNKSLPKEIRKQQQIEHARVVSTEAKLVKAADKLSNLSDLELNPPPTWTKEYIDGYFTWSYAVWLELKGKNDQIDNKLEALFKARNLTDLSADQLKDALDSYYDLIKGSK